ncbi:MAG TPA: FadR/GntR family transcriptional regulator [Anaerolineae bacterium]|nr:FadR/GntR family transcriptional regulator [Anaerolineae bacterium]
MTTPLLEAIPHRRLAEEIVDRIERLILNEELRVGDALPSERELAAQLHVSRNILREALGVLVQKGLLEVRAGSGTYVARPTTEFLRDTLDHFIRFNKSALFELIEARRAIEVEIAEMAAERATPEDRALIADALARLEASVGSLEPYTEADIHFHSTLAVAAKNEILQLLLDSIRGALRENIRVLVQHHATAVEEAMRYHRRIARAVQEHNRAEARTAMWEHLESVRRDLQDLEGQTLALDETRA